MGYLEIFNKKQSNKHKEKAMNFTSTKKVKSIYKMLLILMIISLLCTGCSGAGFEHGFQTSNSDCEDSFFKCAFKSHKKVYDIDDVTLEFSYGGNYRDQLELCLYYNDIPSFEIYFENENGDKIFVKRIEENLVSYKYNYEIITYKWLDIRRIKFNHSEFITIPKEIFTREKGVIWFEMYGIDLKKSDTEIKWIAGTAISYKMDSGKVMLSR